MFDKHLVLSILKQIDEALEKAKDLTQTATNTLPYATSHIK